jgi:chromosome partitioning protein
MNTIGLIQENLKPELEIIGVLMTQYDSRKKIAKQIKCSLKEVFGEKVLNTVIRVNSEIEYSQDNQVPIIFYNKKSNGYADYTELALEVMENGK